MRLLSVVLLHAVRGPRGGDYLSELRTEVQPGKPSFESLETHGLGVLVASGGATLLVPWANVKACLVAPEPEPQAAVEPLPKRGPGRPPKLPEAHKLTRAVEALKAEQIRRLA